METNKSIVLGSYNCRGYNESKCVYARQLLSKVDILYIQEHWLSDDQMVILGNIDSHFLFTGTSGFDNSNVLPGWPYGGTAILWRSSLNMKISVLKSASRRLSAIKVTVDNNMNLLLINVYMPYENGEHNVDSFSEQLIAIESLIADNLDCHVVLGGDFNADFSRNGLHSSLLHSFCDAQPLKVATFHSNASVNYTYHFNMARFSTIDHFIISPLIYDHFVQNVSVLHDVANLSDHDPLFLSLSFNIPRLHATGSSRSNDINSDVRLSWIRANDTHIAQYRDHLVGRLNSVSLPRESLFCCDMNCTNVEHRQSLYKYAHDLIEACHLSGIASIPRAGHSTNCVPGWSEHVKPFHDKSMFWHNLWVESGRPRNGTVADVMRRTRASYHYAIRQARRNENEITRERFAQSLLRGRTRDFWNEVKRIKASKVSCNYAIDGYSNAADIARVFGDKYRELYSSVSYSVTEMSAIRNDIDQQLKADTFNCDFFISPPDVCSAVSLLKRGKADVSNLLSSDHLICAPNDLFVHISMLFTALIIHNFVPDLFLRSAIRPVPKGHNLSLADSSNYRGIAIGSIFCKLFDNVVICKYRCLLSTSDLQFGFKKGHCTQMCTMVLKETISYYVNHNNTTFCTFLDATKAFDRVQYCKLFNILSKRKLPVCIIRLLINFYVDNFVHVTWSGASSDMFVASNGVKQGGVLSPILFCVYIDQLLSRLSSSGVGCYIGNVFVGCLAYADDIVLVAPTPTAMRLMLVICDEFASEFDIKFNASKSKCVVIKAKSVYRSCYLHDYNCDQLTFVINDNDIEFVDNYRHLGHVINSKFDDCDDIYDKRASFIGQVNSLLCYFRKLNGAVRYRLFQSYCMSLFCCELWRLDNGVIDHFGTAYRRAVRRVWSLPHLTHSSLLPYICHCLPFADELCCRFVNFLVRCICHESKLIRFISIHGSFYSRAFSVLGYNMSLCQYMYNFSSYDIYSLNKLFFVNFCNSNGNINVQSTARFLEELIGLRDGTLSFSSNSSFFSVSELCNIIEHVSTD